MFVWLVSFKLIASIPPVIICDIIFVPLSFGIDPDDDVIGIHITNGDPLPETDLCTMQISASTRFPSKNG